MTTRFLQKTLLCFLLFVSVGLSGEAAEVRFRKTARATGPLVLLGDVAEILATDPKEAEFLEKIELFPAPSTGESKTVRAREIRDVVVNRGGSATTIRYEGSATIRIESAKAGAAANSPSPASPPASSPAPRAASPGPSSMPHVGPVVVTTRSMRPGERISARDVILDEARVPVSASPFQTPEQLIGLETARSIPEGKVLDASLVRLPRLVQKNELVSVFVRAPGVRIRTTARAMDDGAEGDLVRIQALDKRSNQMTARVVGIKEVEIYAQGAQVPSEPSRPDPSADRYSQRLMRRATSAPSNGGEVAPNSLRR